MSDGPEDIRRAVEEPPISWGDARAEINHGDKAYEYLSAIKFQTEQHMVDYYTRSAHTHALLFLGDKVDELVATIKVCTGQVLDSNEKLNQNVKVAAQHLHADAVELKARLHVVREDEAA